MKYLFLGIKKICIAFILLYSINFIVSSLNIFIPINIPTISIVSLLGIPGLLSIVVMFLII